MWFWRLGGYEGRRLKLEEENLKAEEGRLKIELGLKFPINYHLLFLFAVINIFLFLRLFFPLRSSFFRFSLPFPSPCGVNILKPSASGGLAQSAFDNTKILGGKKIVKLLRIAFNKALLK